MVAHLKLKTNAGTGTWNMMWCLPASFLISALLFWFNFWTKPKPKSINGLKYEQPSDWESFIEFLMTPKCWNDDSDLKKIIKECLFWLKKVLRRISGPREQFILTLSSIGKTIEPIKGSNPFGGKEKIVGYMIPFVLSITKHTTDVRCLQIVFYNRSDCIVKLELPRIVW